LLKHRTAPILETRMSAKPIRVKEIAVTGCFPPTIDALSSSRVAVSQRKHIETPGGLECGSLKATGRPAIDMHPAHNFTLDD
jgi:hypothetical protein